MEALRGAAAALRQKVAGMVLRAVVGLVKDAEGIQLLQISGLDGEDRDDVERLQEYGFTSNPPAGSEAVALAINGDRSHLLVVAVDHRASRKRNLQPGAVALYTQAGQCVLLTHDGKVLLGADDADDPVIRKSDLAALFDGWTPVAGDGGGALKTKWTAVSSSLGSGTVFSS